jgi:site-specific DNA-methyltransferase (adenine-specific)
MLPRNRIYTGDCVELMKRIDAESIDLIVADPPYNLGKDFGNDSDIWGSVDDWLAWSKEWLSECKRVLKNSGSIFVYGIHRYICYVQCYLYEIGLHYGRQIIWHYENGWSQYTRAPASTYESILWFTKTDAYTYHTIREPYKSTDRLRYKVTKNGKTWKPNPLGRRGGDIWHIPTLAGRRFAAEKVNHPTQKPLKLCDRIVVHFSNPGDLILVPFAGSGSECVSAKMNRRDFIGFEINPHHVRTAEVRLQQLKSRGEPAEHPSSAFL